MSAALTESQRQAIQARGNVIVVASAGTGKTSTLVRRCVSLLLEEACSLDEILMVTFTEAAAAQMRSRIRAELQALADAESDAAANRIRKQLMLLDTAPICTLHGFCLRLVRQHFHELAIDPSVIVLDEKQTAPLISRTFDALFHQAYDGRTPEAVAVQDLVRHFGRGSDHNVRSLLLKLHRYTQSLDNPEAWLAAQQQLYQQEKPLAWQAWLGGSLSDWRRLWLPELQPFARVPAVNQFIQALEQFRPDSKPADFARRLSEANHEGHWPHGTRTSTRKRLKSFLSDVDFLGSALGQEAGVDAMLQDWQWVQPHMRTLLRLTRAFHAAFSQAKRDMGGVDFADLEQFALRLLRDSRTGLATATARLWQERLRFLFVDEYQDINRAQDAILTALSRDDERANRFLVGDVKQSIYRFRLANPGIFCEREKEWRHHTGQTPSRPRSGRKEVVDACPELWPRHAPRGQRIPLADNFRSREVILDFVNSLFAALMRPEIGGVAYEADVHLRFASVEQRKALAADADRTASCVELHLIDNSAEDGDPSNGEDLSQAQAALLDLLTVEREARLVALRLRALRAAAHPVWDEITEKLRPVDWSDMTVLLRSPSDKVEAFAKEFHRLGVPLAASRGSFFQSTEITDLLSLLRMIDNPLQDWPVLAVLRSPLVGLSLDELVEVRTSGKEQPFWSALKRFHRRGQSAEPSSQVRKGSSVEDSPAPSRTLAKIDTFVRQFDSWRELARQSSLSVCLEAVLTETRYEALLLAESRGEERAANVRRLLELARGYDPYQRQGLYRFLRFVEGQEDADSEREPACAQTGNAVRLMSIHKSKGLEFPVVVLAGMGGLFNFQDLRQDILIHERYGVCPKVKPPEADQNYPSIAYWMARREEHRELLGEELRLLYVALTRTRDTLILTGTRKEPRWPNAASGAPGTRELLSARSFLDWLWMWLPQVTSEADWLNDREGATKLLRWNIYAADDSRLVAADDRLVPSEDRTAPGEEMDQPSLSRLQDRLAAKYPQAAAAREPAIKQISRIIWQSEPETEAELLPGRDFLPSFEHTKSRASGLSARAIGDAHHRFLEAVSLDKCSRREDLRQEAALLLEQGILSREEMKALDLDAILAFWNTETGRRIRSSPPGSIHREIPFTARFSPDDFAKMGLCANPEAFADEFFVTRGKVDLAVIQANELWILDFKTDQVAAQALPQSSYGRQLQLYGLALGRIYRRPVTERWLHFLSTGRTISV